MKLLINMTTDAHDMNRFSNSQEFLENMSDFDGVELSWYGPDENEIIPSEFIKGYHLSIPNYWLDFYYGNEKLLNLEFGSKENLEKYYGGSDRSIMIERIREEYNRAKYLGVEYMVFHAADCSFTESITFDYIHSDEEVIDAVIDIANQVFIDYELPIKLLFENLWVPGMRFTDPVMTRRLMDGIRYKNKGIVLDTGHLMHMDTSIKTTENAVKHINKMLDEHGELCRYIKAVHLNQSISGEFIEKLQADPPQIKENFAERHLQVFETIFKIDKHEPFTGPGVKELIERISPEYLTFEFITSDLEQQNEYKRRQMDCLFG